jgi:2-oxoglutarate ferredoxin oxidoreductase subunit alpha
MPFGADSVNWATTGARDGRAPRLINSIYLKPDELFRHNLKLQARFEQAKAAEVRYEAVNTDDADVILVAYGTTSRVCRSAMDRARAAGIRVGLVRPITVSPFPYQAIADLARTARAFLTVEMSLGQMVEDVRLAVCGAAPVHFYGTTGGVVPTASAIAEEARKIAMAEVEK